MRTLLLIVMVALLSACSGGVTPSVGINEALQKSTELNDCKAHKISTADGGIYTVIRCPNSSTTTKNGKANTVTVVD